MRKTSLENGMRTCTKCGISYPAIEEFFYKDSRKEGRLLPVCKICKVTPAKERRMAKKAAKYLISHPTPTTKICKKCGNEKEANTDNFLPVEGNVDGLDGSCRECYNNEANERLHQSSGYLDRQQKREREEEARNPEPGKQRCTKCSEVKFLSEFYLSSSTGKPRTMCIDCCNKESRRNDELHKDQRKATKIRSKAFNKAVVLVYYGGDNPVCACCGEPLIEFLALDHTEGGGNADRKLHGSGPTYYSNLIVRGLPPKLRALCHNCNTSRNNYGYCPHQGLNQELKGNLTTPSIDVKPIPPRSVNPPSGKIYCLRCGGYKDPDEFANDAGRPSGKFPWCKECSNAYRSAIFSENYQKKRMQVLQHYGGNPPRCKCCGTTITEFLTVHHIGGGGKEERAKLTVLLYQKLIKEGFPPGYEIFCHNCHLSAVYHGYCPHDGRPEDSACVLTEKIIKEQMPKIKQTISDKLFTQHKKNRL